MKKEDLRKRNNTSANRNLHIELDLWIKFIENNNKPVLIGTAISKGRFNDNVYSLFYSPVDCAKDSPFLLTFQSGSEYDASRFENITQAKYYLKKSDNEAKWQKNKQ